LFFAGTEYATRRCPRRHVRDHPDVTAALALWRSCDGKPGVEALRVLSTHTVDAMGIIDAGRAAKMESDAAQDRADRMAQDAARPTRGKR
jgi:hypothetical protein